MSASRKFAPYLCVAAVLAGSCSRDVTLPDANRYSNDVDGIPAARWPAGWQLHRAGHDSLPGSTDLLTLATFGPRPSSDSECGPVAFAAIDGMKEGDALFQLRTVKHLFPERPAGPRPFSFISDAQPAEWPRRCKLQGVDVRVAAFERHGRLYEAFVWADAPFGERRRDEVEAIWANLDLSPITTGEHEAETGRSYWHEISTHCGITDTTFDGREWTADPPLIRHGGQPLPAWDSPTAVGTIVLEKPDSAVFSSRVGGRTARFRPRVESDPPLGMCE